MQKKYDTAIEVFNDGLSVYPEGRQLKIGLGWCYAKKGMSENDFPSIGFWAKLLQKSVRDAASPHNIAWTYLWVDDHENAIRYYEKSMEQAIKNGWFGNYKYWITHAEDLNVLKSNPRFQALLEKVNSYPVGGK